MKDLASYPGLLSTLLYQDPKDAVESLPKLKTIAEVNGRNLALEMTVKFLERFSRCPNPEQLKAFIGTEPQMTPGVLDADLEEAERIKAITPMGTFDVELARAWGDAEQQYVEVGYQCARQIAGSGLSNASNMTGHQFERRMKKLYGEDVSKWDRVGFSQLWLQEYLDANPFKAASTVPLEPGERIVSRVRSLNDDDEMTTSCLTIINGDAIVPVPINWWWEDRFALGKIAWLAGLPGAGKTMVMLDAASRITTGRDFPDGAKNTLPSSRVLIAMAEDGLDDTVVPRLIAAGADLKMISFLNRVVGENEDRTPKLDSDINHLKTALADMPDVRLLIMDPMTAYFGDININVDKETRPVTTALKRLCEEFNIGFMGVIHNNKQNDANSIQKILGCSSVSGAARAIYGCSVDPEDKTKHYFTFIKGNCSSQKRGIEYEIETKTVEGIKTAGIKWGEQTDDTAEDCLKRERDSRYERKEGKQIMLAQGFVPTFLKGKGAVHSRDVYSAALEQEGISSKSINAAIDKFYKKNVIRQQMKDGWTMRWVEEEKVMTAEMAVGVL